LDGSEILDCNAKFLTIFGRTRDEVIGKPSIMHWADPSERQEIVRILQAKGQVAEFECKMLNKQGDVKTCLTSLKLYPKQGILEGSIIDISERKRAEDALKKSQHFVEKILNTTPTLIYIYDLTEQRNVYANREILAFLGYTNEQIQTMGSSLFSQILHPDDVGSVANHHLRLSKAGDNQRLELEYRMKHSDGEWRWLHSIDIPFSRTPEGAVNQILGSAEDVTKRKKAEEALADSEAKYRALVLNADDTILLTDLRGKHIFRNPAYFRDLGYEVGQKIELDGFAKVHPDDLPAIKEKMAELLTKGSSTSEYRVKHRNGSWVYRLARSTLIYNQRNEPYAILAIIRDVTENRKAEQALRDSEQKYQLLNEKLNIVGAFARHDIRNKLEVISGNVYLARKIAKENHVLLLTKLDQIDIASHNIVRILDFSKDYEALGSKALSLVNVGKAVDDASSAFSDLKGIKIKNECADFKVLADDMLTTIFHNLIENSLKYGKKATQIKVCVQTNTDGSATIVYEDDGVGLDDAVRPKLFEKGVGKGTGYGLYLIKHTCELYGWSVKETGERGTGARFELNIPTNQKPESCKCTVAA
jgi:PAS domain S-box-containing protein